MTTINPTLTGGAADMAGLVSVPTIDARTEAQILAAIKATAKRTRLALATVREIQAARAGKGGRP